MKTLRLKSTCSINAEVVNVSDIVADGYKVSGNSFCARKKKVLHHGTLLVNVNLNNLNAILTPNELNISDRAVQYRRSKVRNLTDFNTDISIDLSMNQLSDYFLMVKMVTWLCSNLILMSLLRSILKNKKDISWIYERTPDFEMELGCPFPNQHNPITNARINLKVSHGPITEIENIRDISNSLKNSLNKKLIDRPIFNESIENLKDLITKKLFNNYSNKSRGGFKSLMKKHLKVGKVNFCKFLSVLSLSNLKISAQAR